MTTPALPNDGSALVVNFPTFKVTSFITFTVTSVSSSTSNCGLAEFAAYGSLAPASSPALPSTPSSGPYSSINLAFSASVSASSQDIADDSLAVRAIDGIVGGYLDDGTGDQVSF